MILSVLAIDGLELQVGIGLQMMKTVAYVGWHLMDVVLIVECLEMTVP